MSAQTTDEIELQLWPTPQAFDAKATVDWQPGSEWDRNKIAHTLPKAAALWPTPTVPNGGRSVKHVEDWRSNRSAYHNGKKVQVDLNAAVKMLPTPQARDWKGPQGRSYQGKAVDLPQAVKMMPTPTSREYKGGRSPEALETAGRSSTNSLSDFVQAGAQLNPDWVEWLMGFPPGWTDIDTDAEFISRDPHWWDVEPPIPRVATGVAHRVGRLKCLGNAVVPAQFYPIFAAIADIENNKS